MTFHSRAAGVCSALGALAATLALAPGAFADTYVANKLGDHAPNGCTHRDCTLREAITKANIHPGLDTVVIRGGEVYNLGLGNLSGDEDANATGDLDVLGPLTIRSSNKKLATVDANRIDRVFEVGPSAPVSATFKRVTIRGGRTVAGSDQHGGGIDSENGGTLKLLKSKVVGNTATDSAGGGIAATNGTLKVTRSLIARNSAEVQGGGFYSDGTATITKSTIAGNVANNVGGGIHNAGGTLILKSSTVSGNAAPTDAGGGVENYDTAKLVNDTITQNHAQNGGGLDTDGTQTTLNAVTIARNTATATGGGIDEETAPFTLRNSLVALNSVGGGGLGPDCYLAVTPSAGHNLIGDTTDCGGVFGGSHHDIVNVNPRIAQLAHNGGPTKTIALRRHSKAINHAGNDAPSRDQRGVKRHDPDIGAFER